MSLRNESIVMERSFHFSLEMISLYKHLTNEKEYIISKQLLRSSTSIGANINEATAAFSKSDFIYKMSLASKEARETKYWLRLLSASRLITTDITEHIKDSEELISILTAIVKTSQSTR